MSTQLNKIIVSEVQQKEICGLLSPYSSREVSKARSYHKSNKTVFLPPCTAAGQIKGVRIHLPTQLPIKSLRQAQVLLTAWSSLRRETLQLPIKGWATLDMIRERYFTTFELQPSTKHFGSH